MIDCNPSSVRRLFTVIRRSSAFRVEQVEMTLETLLTGFRLRFCCLVLAVKLVLAGFERRSHLVNVFELQQRLHVTGSLCRLRKNKFDDLASRKRHLRMQGKICENCPNGPVIWSNDRLFIFLDGSSDSCRFLEMGYIDF